MILVDTGPLVAIINRGDPNFQACVKALSGLKGPMLTTWPVFTEAMYLLHRAEGWKSQKALWQFVERGVIQLAEITPTMMAEMARLMSQYEDTPMDLADASLVALANEQGLTHIFTLDSDFEVYRLSNKKRFTLIP